MFFFKIYLFIFTFLLSSECNALPLDALIVNISLEMQCVCHQVSLAALFLYKSRHNLPDMCILCIIWWDDYFAILLGGIAVVQIAIISSSYYIMFEKIHLWVDDLRWLMVMVKGQEMKKTFFCAFAFLCKWNSNIWSRDDTAKQHSKDRAWMFS